MKLYAIRDSKAESFLPILEASNDAHAMRIIADAMTQSHQLVQYADDYHVYCLAEYDNGSGNITPNLPEPVASLIEIREMYFEPQPQLTEQSQKDLEEYLNGSSDGSASAD